MTLNSSFPAPSLQVKLSGCRPEWQSACISNCPPCSRAVATHKHTYSITHAADPPTLTASHIHTHTHTQSRYACWPTHTHSHLPYPHTHIVERDELCFTCAICSIGWPTPHVIVNYLSTESQSVFTFTLLMQLYLLNLREIYARTLNKLDTIKDN